MYTKSKTNKKIMYILILTLLVGVANANVIMNWQNPSIDDEYVAGYPTKIRAVIISTNNLTECNIRVDGVSYKKIFSTGYTNIVIEKEVKINEGNHNVTINCSNDQTQSVEETKTFNTSITLNFQEDNTNIIRLTIIAILYMFLIIIHQALRNEDTYMLLTSGMMLLLAIYATTIINEVYMWVPVVVSIILLIDDMLVAVGFRGKRK